MPIYLYKCLECGYTVDIDHPMMDSPEVLCPECSTACKKMPGIGAVSFKGGGWGKDAR